MTNVKNVSKAMAQSNEFRDTRKQEIQEREKRKREKNAKNFILGKKVHVEKKQKRYLDNPLLATDKIAKDLIRWYHKTAEKNEMGTYYAYPHETKWELEGGKRPERECEFTSKFPLLSKTAGLVTEYLGGEVCDAFDTPVESETDSEYDDDEDEHDNNGEMTFSQFCAQQDAAFNIQAEVFGGRQTRVKNSGTKSEQHWGAQTNIAGTWSADNAALKSQASAASRFDINVTSALSVSPDLHLSPESKQKVDMGAPWDMPLTPNAGSNGATVGLKSVSTVGPNSPKNTFPMKKQATFYENRDDDYDEHDAHKPSPVQRTSLLRNQQAIVIENDTTRQARVATGLGNEDFGRAQDDAKKRRAGSRNTNSDIDPTKNLLIFQGKDDLQKGSWDRHDEGDAHTKNKTIEVCPHSGKLVRRETQETLSGLSSMINRTEKVRGEESIVLTRSSNLSSVTAGSQSPKSPKKKRPFDSQGTYAMLQTRLSTDPDRPRGSTLESNTTFF